MCHRSLAVAFFHRCVDLSVNPVRDDAPVHGDAASRGDLPHAGTCEDYGPCAQRPAAYTTAPAQVQLHQYDS